MQVNMQVNKIVKTGRKATIAGFDLDNRDKCKWCLTSACYITTVHDSNGENDIPIEHSMGSIGQMEFVCPTDSDLCRIISENRTVLVLYGDIGTYPKNGTMVDIEYLRKLELSGETKISFLFK